MWKPEDHPREKPGTSDGGQFRDYPNRKGMPSTGSAGMPYDDGDGVVEAARDARNPNITARELSDYAGSDNEGIRDAAFSNPARKRLYRETDKTARDVMFKSGRITKKDLERLSPQAGEYIRLQRRFDRATRAEGHELQEQLWKMTAEPHLNDDTFILMAMNGHARELATRGDIDARRVETLLNESRGGFDDRALVGEMLASNPRLHESAWESLETHAPSARTLYRMAENPSYPAKRANMLAESWCAQAETIEDPYSQTFQPRLGRLLADRADLDPKVRERVERCNVNWYKYAMAHNMRNERFARDQAAMGMPTGDYDPMMPPESL